jgi:hypothetical protein
MEKNTISLDALYKKSDTIIFRYVAGEAVLVPISAKSADLNSIFALNETAARIWELIDGQRTLQKVVQQLVEEYDVNPETAAQEILVIVGHLVELGALIKV